MTSMQPSNPYELTHVDVILARGFGAEIIAIWIEYEPGKWGKTWMRAKDRDTALIHQQYYEYELGKSCFITTVKGILE